MIVGTVSDNAEGGKKVRPQVESGRGLIKRWCINRRLTSEILHKL